MTARPVVSVYSKESAIVSQVPLPDVFSAPIRDDIVQFVHANMSKNRRQAHGVFWMQGHQHSAESWGTGRAVARIPRIGGSGTSRSGQGAFGNMCRKGRMFAPLKTWRKWHKKINQTQKRHAVASALAASAVAPLVLARGHNVNAVPELPLVVDSLNFDKTSTLLTTLHKIGASGDLTRVRKSKASRAGQNKMRYSRFKLAKGPLLIYGDENPQLKRLARNLPGVDSVNVHRLNLLQLAPGGHLGRFVIFTKDAFTALDKVFGTNSSKSVEKSGYQLNRSLLAAADIARIINSDQVQAKLRAIKTSTIPTRTVNKNPLKNRTLLQKLNPYANTQRKLEAEAAKARSVTRKAALKLKRSKAGRAEKAVRTKRFNGLTAGLESSFQAAQKVIDDEIKAGLYNPNADAEDDE